MVADADDTNLSVRVANNRFELADRLVLANVFNAHRRRDCFADANGLDEPPVGFEENGARTRQILGHNGIQQAGRHATLHDQASEWRPRRQIGVVVDRVSIARQFGEHLDVPHRCHALARGSRPDMRPAGDCLVPAELL